MISVFFLNMRMRSIYFLCLFLCYFENIESGLKEIVQLETETTKSPNDAEYYLKFVKEPANFTLKALRSHIKLRCEVALSRFINETLSSSVEYKDVRNITDILLKKVRIRWFKNDFQVASERNRITVKKEEGNGTVASSLRIRNIGVSDKGLYWCTANIGKNNVKSSYSEIDIEETVKESDESEDNGPDIHYKSLFTNREPGTTESSQASTIKARVFNISKEELIETPVVKPSNVDTYETRLVPPEEGVCQLYTGRTCLEFLDNQYVFIPYPTKQAELEEKLSAAFKVVTYSNEISSNCVGYAIPSLCFSTFPVCITPNETNALFFKKFDELNHTIQTRDLQFDSEDVEDEPILEVHFEQTPDSELPYKLHSQYAASHHMHTNFKSGDGRGRRYTGEGHVHRNSDEALQALLKNHFQTSLSRSANELRRVCREDCEMLEHELCQKEYAIAKRHPEIGRKLTLEECTDLPLEATDCLQIGIEKHFGSDTCFWENGIYYRGEVNVSASGLPCSKWSSQFIYKMANHPELTGKHNYCRNPGGKEPQPWCYVVSKDKSLVKEFCDIPKCSQKIWIYIIASMLGAFFLFTLCLILICCRQRNAKNNTTAIRNINLPNADKNIYGNSRLNSPIELSDLITHNSNSRRNGISRVPQYSLAQIKFVEELGEGAFGKVYKGELTRDREKVFVAVKALKENASQKTQQDFKREIELISELRHENIVCILGVVLKEEPLCMLFEFMAKGDLHEFLMSKVPPEGCGLSPTQFLMIAQHIASGMEYLAAHHYVHRDLAARNCLVSDNMVVKISDFGLSRDIYSSDYYRVQSKSLLPVRWMPPESILYGKFTTESDVWSYGIVLWEIYSYGLQPYYGYSNQDVINMVRNRQLLQCPTDCPRAVYALMRECWHQAPLKRPTFSFIVQRLSGWLRPNSNLHYDNGSDSSGGVSNQRIPQPTGDPRERIPLMGNHSTSNGSLAGSMPRKLSTAGSVRSQGRLADGNVSEVVESSFRNSSCGSLLESNEKLPQSHRDTVVKIPNVSQPFDI